mgnify:CR=1 FL=1
MQYHQEQIKKEVLSVIDDSLSDAIIHLTGRPGTGKTLLLYDIAKTLSKNGPTVIVHCGMLGEGQIKISEEIENLDVVPVSSFKEINFNLSKYRFILVDESHRIYEGQFNKICKYDKKVCIEISYANFLCCYVL